MTAPRILTRAEQRLAWLEHQGRHRTLTDAETAEVARCLHAIAMRRRRLAA